MLFFIIVSLSDCFFLEDYLQIIDATFIIISRFYYSCTYIRQRKRELQSEWMELSD